MKYWIEINYYRSSISHGFSNTWRILYFNSKAKRDSILRNGLPVKDCHFTNGKPCLSTMGIRLPDRQTVQKARKAENQYGSCSFYNYE